MNVLPRPVRGHETEFEQLVALFDAAQWQTPKQESPYIRTEKAGLLGLWRTRRVFDEQAAEARMTKISVPAHAQFDVPVVGRDPAADAWARREAGKTLDARNGDAAVSEFAGHRVWDLVPDCDGFPAYSPFTFDRNYDRTALYGSVLHGCRDLLGPALVQKLFGYMMADELATWGDALRAWADHFAAENGHTAILNDKGYIERQADPIEEEIAVHVADQAARWAHFWSSRGHGCGSIYDFQA